MKHILILSILTFSLTLKAQTTVTVSGMGSITCPATPSSTWTGAPATVTFSSVTRGSGVTCASAGDGINGSGFEGADADASFNNNRFYTYTVSNSNSGYPFKLTSITWAYQVSSGNATLNVRYSLDGGAVTSFGSINQVVTGTGTVTFTDNLTINPNSTATIYLIPSNTNASTRTVRFRNNSTSVLPIEILNFECQNNPKNIFLNFTTATETNNSHFNIERSADGRSFEKIGEVRGAGNSVTEQQYTFTDEKPLQGMNYYRLEQVDFDGQSSYSPVRSVVFGKSGAVLLYPAPVASALNVRLDEAFEQDADWQMLDMAGRAVSQGVFAAEQTEFSLPVGHLPEGGYVLRITSGQRVLTQQFRKQ